MHEAARHLESMSYGNPIHSPFLDVSWQGPHCFSHGFRLALCASEGSTARWTKSRPGSWAASGGWWGRSGSCEGPSLFWVLKGC